MSKTGSMIVNFGYYAVMQAICIKCEGAFEYSHKSGYTRKYCEACRPLVEREQMNRSLKERLRNPGYKVKYDCNKYASDYFQSPKGKASLAKKAAQRRTRSTDPESYAARVELLHTIQEPCAKCGTPFRITHQVDHIIALCLGGTDDWDNLQPLCLLCHREKTGRDLGLAKSLAPAEGVEV